MLNSVLLIKTVVLLEPLQTTIYVMYFSSPGSSYQNKAQRSKKHNKKTLSSKANSKFETWYTVCLSYETNMIMELLKGNIHFLFFVW